VTDETWNSEDDAALNEAASSDTVEESTENSSDEYLKALQQLQADFENYKKRVVKSSEEAGTRAAGALINKLLPVLDAFDLALTHFSETDTDEAKALIQSRGLLLDTLNKEGLTRIDETGAAFDPTIHDAVMHVPGETPGEQTVKTILRAGYIWKGAVLRPAMVEVQG
jgi:molecular chaperone GrpE